MNPPIFAFTDCKDANALTRLSARLAALFPGSFIETVGIDKDIEAAGCILDTLDALRASDSPAIIIGNLAPRTEKKHKNGAPFSYATVGAVTIVGTETCFAFLSRFGLLDSIIETDVQTACEEYMDHNEAHRIANSQFRSFEYIPLLALWAYQKKNVPGAPVALPKENPPRVWFVDNFGNIKTTLIKSDIQEKIQDAALMLAINGTSYTLPFFERLADVSKGTHACIIGSSGYAATRFVEVVCQGDSAARTLGISVGDIIEL